MKYIWTLPFIFIIGCSSIKTVPNMTNEECIGSVVNRLHLQSMDRIDRDLLVIGVSVECANHNNNPEEFFQ